MKYLRETVVTSRVTSGSRTWTEPGPSRTGTVSSPVQFGLNPSPGLVQSLGPDPQLLIVGAPEHLA